MVAGILEYAALAILYSLLAAAMLESLLYLWHVQDPLFAVRFRLLILAIPPVAPPLFSLLNPGRGSGAFRQQVALLDSHNWLGPESSLSHPGWIALLVVMVATVALLVALDVTGWIRHRLGRQTIERRLPALPVRLRTALGRLEARGLQPSSVHVLDQPVAMAYATGLRRPVILITTPLLELLDDEELEGVLAHELVHIRRRDNWVGWLVFGLRWVSFYNPVALFTFHQISHDTERVCDAEAGIACGRPLALASALIKVYRASRVPIGNGLAWPQRVARGATALENLARRALVEDRVERLVHPESVGSVSLPELRLALALVGVLSLAYFVV